MGDYNNTSNFFTVRPFEFLRVLNMVRKENPRFKDMNIHSLEGVWITIYLPNWSGKRSEFNKIVNNPSNIFSYET